MLLDGISTSLSLSPSLSLSLSLSPDGRSDLAACGGMFQKHSSPAEWNQCLMVVCDLRTLELILKNTFYLEIEAFSALCHQGSSDDKGKLSGIDSSVRSTSTCMLLRPFSPSEWVGWFRPIVIHMYWNVMQGTPFCVELSWTDGYYSLSQSFDHALIYFSQSQYSVVHTHTHTYICLYMYSILQRSTMHSRLLALLK